MFDFIRTHSRLMLGLIVVLIIPSFVFFGVQGYSSFTDGSRADVAKVDGRGITQAEWDQAHQRQVERLLRQMPGIDVKLLDTPQARRETLDALVRERVLLAAAAKQNLLPTDERLQRLFVSDPQFAPVRNPDGSVNRDMLAAQGMNSEMFAQQLRLDLGMRQVLGGIGGTTLTTPALAAAALDPLLQRRELQLQRFDAGSYRSRVEPTDAELEAHYKANEAQFRAPEQASIEYVVLDLQTIGSTLAVSDEDLRRYYEENASRWTVAEERRASHILVAADAGMSAAQRSAAKEKAESLLAELRKAPGRFAELARANSADTGSAAQGGDLDFFGRGAMVKPFEEAAFAMKPGEISNLVESEFGYHIIQLTALRGGERQPFEALRPDIEAEVRQSLAQRRYAEAAEQFTNTVYEQSDSLQPVIDLLKLRKQTAEVQRTPAPGASGALASPRLLEAVFSNDAVVNKRNTEAVEVAPNQLAAARIVQHTPARTLPLAEVRDRVRQAVVAQQAAALARKDGEARLAQAQQAGDAALPQTAVVSRAQPMGLPRPLLDAVLRVDDSRLPAAVGVDLGPEGYAVARVVAVLPRDTAPAEDEARLRGQIARAWATAETTAYYEALKKRFKVEVKERVVAAATEPAAR